VSGAGRADDPSRPGERPRPRRAAGLCDRCAHARVVRSSRGSRFLLCGLSQSDPRFAKYPPQPRMECSGYKE